MITGRKIFIFQLKLHVMTEVMYVVDGAALRGVLEVLQHPGPQFWGPAIGGSGKFLCAVIGL